MASGDIGRADQPDDGAATEAIRDERRVIFGLKASGSWRDDGSGWAYEQAAGDRRAGGHLLASAEDLDLARRAGQAVLDAAQVQRRGRNRGANQGRTQDGRQMPGGGQRVRFEDRSRRPYPASTSHSGIERS